ncbi:MAG: sugar transferase [Pseudomonadota bacterium]
MHSTEPLVGVPAIAFSSKRGYRTFGKRVFDLTLAVLSLPLLLPIIAICWALARSDGGPGFFAHTRIGRNGRAFRCLKIRTMRPDAEALLADLLAVSPAARMEWDETQKLTNDPRVTRIGAVLRKTSLDEFPQIFNVIMGQMSLVGPRPVVAAELDRYGPFASIYSSVRPGVTGLWQVSGRNDLSYGERVQLDVDYVSGLSMMRDIWLLLRTVLEVARRSGI